MRRLGIIWSLSILVFIISCEKPGEGLDQLFPGAGFKKGWSWHGMPTHYTAENLYEYIDGEAELYLAYGFKEMATLTYFWGDPVDSSFVVDIYDMRDELHAFGLYSNYRFPEYQYKDIGTEAIVSEFGIKFYRGNYVVEFKSSVDTKKFNNAMFTIAKKIVKRIETPANLPILALLPAEGKIDRSERYKAHAMLNQDFLPGGLEARYRIMDEEGGGFIILFEDDETAQHGIDELRTFYQGEGNVFPIQSVSHKSGFGVRTRYHGLVLISSLDEYVFGVQDFTSNRKGLALLKRIKKQLEE